MYRHAYAYTYTYTGERSCTALRTYLNVDASADMRAWLQRMSALDDPSIEVSWAAGSPLPSIHSLPLYSQVSWAAGSWLYWIQLDAALLHDVYLVAASCAALLGILCLLLRMPFFALFAVLIVIVSFPVAFAFYGGVLGQTQLPVLAVVSLYLVLGIVSTYMYMYMYMYMSLSTSYSAS